MKKIFLPVLVILTLLVIFWVYKNISLPQIVLWDEGGYIWQGYQINQALKKGDWAGFWRLTKSQFYYPPIQSWYLGLTNFFNSYSANSARFSSLFLLLPTVVLVWLLSHNYLAVFLILTSPLGLFFYSTSLKEGIGAVLSLLVIWLYFQARRRKQIFLFFVTGFLLLVLTLTKYNYGLLVLGVIGLEILIGDRRSWLVFLPVVAGLAYWLSPPGYLKWFLEIIQNKWQVNLYDTTLLGHLLYYPLAIVFGYNFSWLMGILLFLSFPVALLADRRNYQIRVLSFFFLINFLLAEKHISNNQTRFIFTGMPAFFIVGSWGMDKLLFSIKKLLKKPLCLGLAMPILLLVGVVILKDLVILPKLIKSAGSHEVGTAVFYEKDYQNDDRFNFDHNYWPKVINPKPQKIEEVFSYILNTVDLNKRVTLINAVNEFSPDLFNFYLAKQRENIKKNIKVSQYSEYLVVLEIQPGSRFDTLDYQRFSGPRYAASKNWALNSGFPMVAKKDFFELGIRIFIFARP